MKIYTKIINNETKECLIINQVLAKQQRLELMDVEFGYNGKCYLLGYLPQQPLEELKQEKLVLLEKNIERAFYSVYPLHKQNNIGIFGTDEEREQFKLFHTTLVTEYDNRVLAVNNATSKEELDLIEMDFEDVLKNMLC